MNIFKCDKCGIETYIEPPKEAIFDEITVSKDEKGNEKKVKQQRMGKMYLQDPSSGKVGKIDVPLFKDLKERCYIVRLKIGNEIVQRDFCKKCLDDFKEQLTSVFETLAQVEPK